jgi:type I restriction enzyme R subunit
MFMKLRLAVVERYSDTVDYKQYEGQIQKLIDTHVTTEKVEVITELVNIFDKEKFQQEVENTTGKAAKADKIASRTAKHITEKMDEDPAFYKKFSQMLRETIFEYETHRINEVVYLMRVMEIMNNVLAHTDSDIPEVLDDKDVAKAFYGLINEEFKSKFNNVDELKKATVDAALEIDKIILSLVRVDWQNQIDTSKKMIYQIGDYIIDEIRDKYNLQISFEEIDLIAERCVEVAKLRYKQQS